MKLEILTNQEMSLADKQTIEDGTDSYQLMKNAASAAFKIIDQRYRPQSIRVLCGPGNNGGDGFVIAKMLKEIKWDVSVYCLVPIDKLKGDAHKAALEWNGPIVSFNQLEMDLGDIILDAVFGTGLSKDLNNELQALFNRINAENIAVISIDIPSGINGSNGQASDGSLKADLTITFCRKKVGHVLFPGASYAGEVLVCDIGISDKTIQSLKPAIFENNPLIWKNDLVFKSNNTNKYDYGHLVILGGPKLTGASCLAARSALRAGIGLCSICGYKDVANVYRGCSPNVMVQEWDEYKEFSEYIEDERKNIVLIGPGAGLDNISALQDLIISSCTMKGKKCVLDADVFSAFKDNPSKLCEHLHSDCILTPHEGEFVRLFPDLTGSKVERALKAAEISGANILLKGADTIIANPSGDVIINTNGPATLATGGSGDVLAGLISGLYGMGMPAFYACAAGAWIHGKSAENFGPGLTSTDIIEQIPKVLSEFT
jgi:NAD(P)H-hydrate epimerase